jgi:aspartate/methionine/tyrosine aminotransferase
MSLPSRVMSSLYMPWAKTRSHAKFNLATSGVMNYPLAELPVKLEDLELCGPSYYGYPPLQEAIAAHYGVTPDCISAATGTSMANHLAMAAAFAPGDEVVVEHPTYELLLATLGYLGADIKRFARTPESGFRLDPAEVERAVTPHTRLIVVTNLHNPTSTLTGNDALRKVGVIAKRVGARVLVDEVYLDAAFEKAPRSAYFLGSHFVVTNSLTKVYGLSGLRCGWVLAEPALIQRIWQLNDLFGVIPAHPAERLSCIAFANLDVILARTRRLLDANRAVLNRFIDSRQDLEGGEVECGTVSFPRLKSGTVEKFCTISREKFETTVVPGSFFEMPEFFRIGIGGETGMLAAGLERLGLALDQM